MRVLMFVLLLLSSTAITAQVKSPELREQLLAMEQVDQSRVKCNTGRQDEMLACYANFAKTVDADNAQKLEAMMDRYGLPTPPKAGADGFSAFMTVLQHTASDKLRKRCEKPIRDAFRRKEISPSAYANFVDRTRLHEGKPQLYGTGFDIKDGKLVMSRTRDVKRLDRRRSSIGLPPMSEYIKMLAEMYHLPIEPIR